MYVVLYNRGVIAPKDQKGVHFERQAMRLVKRQLRHTRGARIICHSIYRPGTIIFKSSRFVCRAISYS